MGAMLSRYTCRYCYGGTVGIMLAGKPGVAKAIAAAHPGPAQVQMRDGDAFKAKEKAPLMGP